MTVLETGFENFRLVYIGTDAQGTFALEHDLPSAFFILPVFGFADHGCRNQVAADRSLAPARR